MNITAALVREKDSPFELTQVQLNGIKKDEALIRVIACGFCGSDEHARRGLFPTPFPAVFGHEGCGEIVDPGTTGFKKGDLVGMSYGYCGVCERCLDHETYGCDRNRELNFGGVNFDGSHRLTLEGGAEISTFFGQSAFASYAVVHKNNLYALPAGIDARICAPLGCGIQTGAGAVLNYLKPQPDSSILIAGCGVVGLSAVMAAKIAGLKQIICVDRAASRLKLAESLGATHTINTGNMPDYDVIAKSYTGGRGPDYAIDTTGNAQCVRLSLRSVRSLGVCVLLGSTAEITFHGEEELMGVGKTLVGLVEGCSVPQEFIPKLLNYYREGKFPFDKLITFYAFEEINKARDDMLSGDVLKPVIVMQPKK